MFVKRSSGQALGCACLIRISALALLVFGGTLLLHSSGRRGCWGLATRHAARADMPLQQNLPIPNVDPAILFEADLLELRDLLETQALMQRDARWVGQRDSADHGMQ